MGSLVYLILMIIQVCTCKQTWQEEPSYTEVNPGESAILACKIFNKEGTCSWQKDGKPQGMFAEKIEWAGDQSSGDCSLRVFDATNVDDGDWECQVTASSFSAHDALTSKIAKLIIRVAPKSLQLQIGNSIKNEGHNFTVREGISNSIKCISRHGNPPSRIKWFLGSMELPSSEYNQTNHTEIDNPKTWMTVSILRTSFMKEDHGRALRCVSVHEAYGSISKDISIILDVQYSPTVTIQGAPTKDIEEDQDRVSLQCLSDANPIANIIWKRVGEEDPFSFQQTLEFNPATRTNSGTYACKASNIVGVSNPLSVQLEVKYPPKIIEVSPKSLITAFLHNQTVIKCKANGEPVPKYEWIQVTPTGRKIQRGTNATLKINDVTYDHQGQYFCVAYNVIKGSRKSYHSKPVSLEVIGKPNFLRYSEERYVEVERGTDAFITLTVCSQPKPKRTTWEWGSLRIDAGQIKDRYQAYELDKESEGSNCYQARLRIQHVTMSDSRNYYLTVVNARGEDRYAVALIVKEPVNKATVIIVVISCLLILVILTMIILYTFKAEKCCFAPKSDFKATDIENSMHRDIEYQKNGNGIQGTNGHSNHVNGREKCVNEQQWQ